MRGKVCTRLQLSGRSFFGCRWKLCRTIAMPVLPQGSNFWRVWNHSQRVYNLVSSITLVYFRLLLPTVFKIYKQPFFATGVFALNGTTRWVGSSCPVYCIYASADSACLTVWSQCLSPAPMLTARLNQCFCDKLPSRYHFYPPYFKIASLMSCRCWKFKHIFETLCLIPLRGKLVIAVKPETHIHCFTFKFLWIGMCFDKHDVPTQQKHAQNP